MTLAGQAIGSTAVDEQSFQRLADGQEDEMKAAFVKLLGRNSQMS